MNNAQENILKKVIEIVEDTRQITNNEDESDYIRNKAKREGFDNIVSFLQDVRLIRPDKHF